MDQIKITDLAQPHFKANPYPFYARLRAENPVCRTTFLRQPTWLITRYDDVLAVLRDERFVKDWLPRTRWMHRLSGPVTRHMLNKDGPDHTRLRTLVHKAFTPSLVERLRDRVQSVCDELLNDLEAKGRMDLMSGYALPCPLTIITELLGMPAEERRRFHSLTRSSLASSTLIGVLRALPDQKLLIRQLRKVIALRRREPRNDLISALVQAEEAGDRLSEEELVGMIMLLLVAGYETTVNLIGNGALALMQQPKQWDLWERNPALADLAVEELLRYARLNNDSAGPHGRGHAGLGQSRRISVSQSRSSGPHARSEPACSVWAGSAFLCGRAARAFGRSDCPGDVVPTLPQSASG